MGSAKSYAERLFSVATIGPLIAEDAKTALANPARKEGVEFDSDALDRIVAEMTRPTVDRYLDLLEQTYVIFRLPSFSTNPRKEIAKGQKVFFWDTGIRNALLGAFSTDEFRPDIGALWENWVIAEAAKRNALLGSPAELRFWRTRAQSEVDLVVRQGDRLRAFDIKWSARRALGRAFHDAYGVEVEPIRPQDPFLEGVIAG